ncbi:MAG: hypothetical protein ACO2ZZ_07870 [Cyclobacteriaceae bacterium]
MFLKTLRSYLLLVLSIPAYAGVVDTTRLTVMIDCRGCDGTYIQQNITSVDHVRDMDLADVYVLINRSWSASSVLYQIDFQGKRELEGIDNSFNFDLSTVLTSNERRDELVRVVSAGLSSYLLHTGLIKEISVDLPETDLNQTAGIVDDPWNNWVFEISGNYDLRGQELRRQSEMRFGAEVDKLTDEWRVRGDYSYNREQLSIKEDSSNFISVIERIFLGGSVVKSLGNHWSTGLFANYSDNTAQNIKSRYQIGPAVEYSLFDYRDVLTREVVVGYRIGYFQQSYLETTIYDKDIDKIINHNIFLNVRFRKPWGTISSRVNYNTFLNDLERTRLNLDNWVSVRLFQGFNVRFQAEYSIIRDQINLAKGNASLEDVILQQRAIATGYELNLGIGVSYTFGSIYNNILNTRL